MKKARPGEMLGRGRRMRQGGVTVQFDFGEGIDLVTQRWMRSQFETARRTLLTLMKPAEEDAPLLDELKERGYDLATLRFSISLTAAGHYVHPKRMSCPRQVPGVLSARWGRVPEDRTPDLVTSWARPCRKADSNLFHCWLSMFLVDDQCVSLREAVPFTLMERLKKLGFDIRTLRFKVRHSAQPDTPSSDAGTA